MSQAPPSADPASQPAPTARRRLRWWVWLLLAAIVGPCAYVQAPREIGRWYLAAAEVERGAGRKEDADRHMVQAQKWASDVPELLFTRAQWRQQDGQYAAALDDLNQLNEQLPENPAILLARSQALQHLARHQEAIADFKVLDRMSLTKGIIPRAQALNGLAYARAVGKLELDEALNEVEQALKFEQNDPMILDTRGFILYHQGKYKDALADMNIAVQGVEDWLKKPPAKVRINNQDVAVVRYHRSLVLEKLGRFAEAKYDRARAKQLIGREPDESLF